MSTKIKLIEKINHIEDDNYLEALLEFLEESEKTPIALSDHDLLDIDKSSQQIKDGKFLTQNELKKQVNEWIEK